VRGLRSGRAASALSRRLSVVGRCGGCPCQRYELPNLGAVNFLIRRLLGDGATSSLRLDAQAKALGEWLRARSIKVPQPLVKT